MTKTMKPATAIGGHGMKRENECSSPISSFPSHLLYPQSADESTVLWTTSGKVAGCFNPATRTFVKHCRHEHVLRRPPAIAYDVSVVAELNRLGCQSLRVVLEDGTVLTAPFTALLDCGFELDRGHGRQLALQLRYWARQNPEQSTLPLWGG